MSAPDIIIPRVSDSMEEATVGRWLKSEGEAVRANDPVVEIETDKTTMELQAESDGFLTILVAEGETAAVGAPIGRLSDEAAAEPSTRATLAPRESPPPARVLATPIARRIAAEHGIDLGTVGGSGPDGRIHKRDVEAAVARSTERQVAAENSAGGAEVDPAASAETSEGRTDGADESEVVTPLTRVQAIVARRMTEAKRDVPHYYVSAEVEMTAAVELRRTLQVELDDPKISLNDFVVMAVARALAVVPQANRSWSERGLVTHDGVHLGLAVALDDGGLIVPVVRHAERLTFGQLASTTRDLAQRAREGRLRGGEAEGGTFTVSNLGMFGVTEFHAIINPPESGILAVGATVERVIALNGSPAIRPMMTISLSADHRVYSGAAAAGFVAAVREQLEHPLRLIAK